MESKELRIGNYFKTWDIDKPYGEEYFPIESFKQNNSGDLGVCFRNGSCWCVIEHIEPIELTEEWLERFGFEKDYDVFKYKEKR